MHIESFDWRFHRQEHVRFPLCFGYQRNETLDPSSISIRAENERREFFVSLHRVDRYFVGDFFHFFRFGQIENSCRFVQRDLSVGFLHTMGDFIAEDERMTSETSETNLLPNRVEKNIHEESKVGRWNIAFGEKYLNDQERVEVNGTPRDLPCCNCPPSDIVRVTPGVSSTGLSECPSVRVIPTPEDEKNRWKHRDNRSTNRMKIS